MRKNNVNKRKLLVMVMMVLVVATLAGCKKDKHPDVIIDDEPVVTEAPVVEPEVTPAPAETTPVPTEEPEVEATPEPTEDPYSSINNSDLIGVEWIESFVGIIDEAKVVVYSLETGRKEIIEKDAVVKINPEKDVLAVYLPEEYKYANSLMGIFSYEGEVYEHSRIFYLDVETTWDNGPQMAAVYVEHNGEEIALSFVLVPEE